MFLGKGNQHSTNSRGLEIQLNKSSSNKRLKATCRNYAKAQLILNIIAFSALMYYNTMYYPATNNTLPLSNNSPHDTKSKLNIQRQASSKSTMKRDKNLPRIVALVFPQFHKDQLNDNLWGNGFTDWNNLKNAPTKNKLGYEIPRPTELGYYDLTKPGPRKLQGELAKEYGIDGFIFHHYWFYDEKYPGQATLSAPLEAMLKDGYPDIPFALDWVALKWDKSWHGQVRKDFVFPEPGVLQKQYFPTNYTDEAITTHYNWLRQFFHHPNYIKVHGQPLLMVYAKKPGSFIVLKRLRELARKDGLPGLYITVGFHRPHEHLQSDIDLVKYPMPRTKRVPWDVFNKTVAYPAPSEFNRNTTLSIPTWCSKEQLQKDIHNPKKRSDEIPGVITSFDNTPRRNFDDAFIWSADHPDIIVEKFKQSLYAASYYESCCFNNEKKEDDDRFIIINAFNEWAEGMVMEPSNVFGRKFLESVRDVKLSLSNKGC